MTDRPNPTDPTDPARQPADPSIEQSADTADHVAVDAPEASGSRWEHQPGSASDPTVGAPEPIVVTNAAPGTDPTPPSSRPTPWARRLGLAGAAAALVAVGGLGGFALGHATADEGDRFRPSSFPFDGDGERPDFDGDHRFEGGHGPGFAPPGHGGQLPPRFDEDYDDSDSDSDYNYDDSDYDGGSDDTENSSTT